MRNAMRVVTTKQSGLIQGVNLHDTMLVDLKENVDYRGSFTEIFQEYWGSAISPVQWSMVRSNKGVFRGMHYHRRHDEYFSIMNGSCYLGLKDFRVHSPTYMKTALYYLCGEDLKALIFPVGILHGWYYLEPSLHIQAVSESYADYGDSDNYGCRWDDPDLGIDWPFKEAILSDRAQTFGDLKDLPPFDKKLS
ncbi:dTDP-4-dehydrorhamnose 3,5-epimerase family protein [Hyunsoonleella sp. SJ7]|uniref:dTDP-4-dehydrorhamnose 3,5-epimerase n=1 Tax=Hyunsoonleella aquatilis TaxID=2762758 RepID=A0A923HBP6_9FLAO|nr:dTDP-4-dehydrorhamnose 3,5-epimerase family protein [Hyunsoonleella aquatilis]MBC3758892.1 dTDP-4-dehydrorhamnose 3,5-epimerase family protein [Hyunsoonleella aquatilis]